MAELVERGADVNSNVYRGTPLLWATYSDQVEAAEWLIDQEADPSLRHDFGGREHGRGATALHLAAQFGNLRCLRLLLERGADPHIKDELFQGTPVGWAEFGGQKDAVKILREHAWPVNAPSLRGSSRRSRDHECGRASVP